MLDDDFMKDITDGIAASAVNRILQDSENFNYLCLIWRTQSKVSIRLEDMSRSHVRNTLQWCIRKGADPDDEKDGIRYADWIAYLTMRLLDPDLKE